MEQIPIIEPSQAGYTGKVMDGVIVLDGEMTLPEGTVVKVTTVEPKTEAEPSAEPQAASTLGERLMKFAGIAEGLPPDFAENHDHYLHGVPKRK